MDYQLQNKLALVTGSTKGIGKAAIQQLHAEGAQVIIHGRSPAEAQKLADSLKERAYAVTADLSNKNGVDQLIAQIKRIGQLDILVNNAGIFEPKDFLDIPDEDWFRFFEVNVMSGIRLSKAFLPGMLKQNWGRIIFISSESGINIPIEMIHYGMTKTAQLAVSRGMSELTKGTAVTVNAILPGPTMSDGVKTFVDQLGHKMKKNEEEMKKFFFKEGRPTSLIQRFAEPQEVANLITYVASPISSATNGAALRVDGGVVKSII